MLRKLNAISITRNTWLLLVGTLMALPATVQASQEDLAKQLNGKLQKTKSKMMGMQIDQAVSFFKEATELLDQLNTENPQHKDMKKLQNKYDKISKDLAKKVVQRARRSISPMESDLEKKLSGSDKDQIKQSKDKLTEALAKHQENLEIAGGDAGTSLIESVQELIAKADGKLGTAPAKKKDLVKSKTKKKSTKSSTGTTDTKELISQIQGKFRSARHADTQELVKMAEEIKELIAQLNKVDPDHNKLPDFEKKVEKMVADAYASDLKSARSDIERRHSRVLSYLERNREDEREHLKEQRDLLVEVLESHRAALIAVGEEGKKIISDTEAIIKEVDQKIGATSASDNLGDEWAAKLKVFTREGEKNLHLDINGAAVFIQLKKHYAEAQELWDQYQKVEFPSGKTYALQEAEKKFKWAIETVESNLDSAISSRWGKVKKNVQRIASLFESDQEWKKDSSKQPLRFADELIVESTKLIEEFAGYVPDYPKLAALQTQLKQLTQENTERRNASKALTFMKADKFQGKGAKKLKEFARKLVPKKYKDVKALRVTIFSEDWKEETVTEWTDTTHSSLRTRTTRTVMACVAAKHTDGVFRHFGYLSQNRKSDGSWGSIYGHLTDTRNPMLEENVKKDEPEEE